ncbi:MAG: PrpR N-terminal domain-containing protein [Clostridiales bacterium]|nr:PrpR N-terminal domain-containing protein [Clostridiales bacterium]
MGKIALLVPREDMLYQAHNILQEKKIPIVQMRVTTTENTVMEARRMIADGATILIARGLQASLVKQYTDIPVIEIVVTAQEMALLVMRARQIVKKSRPVIAVVGFQNMFCDMSYFDELYNIELRTYFGTQNTDLRAEAQRAVADGVDLIIGGDVAVQTASRAGIASLFLSSTEDSLRQAFLIAENMDFAMGAEKTEAQFETLLDYTFGGVIQLDEGGRVTAVNSVMEDILGQDESILKGSRIQDVIPQITEEAMEKVLKEGQEYSLFLEWNQNPFFAVLAPVIYDAKVDGVILTCNKIKKQAVPSEGKNKGQAGGYLPLVRFEDILQESKAMRECVRLAGLYAVSEHPVVLMGESGTEKRMLAEGIHNSSSRKRGPFLDVPCEGLSEEDQRTMIFGERGAALQAQDGTLLIRDVDRLTAANQYRLYQLIRFHVCHGSDIARLRKVNVRVMVTIERPLSELMREGTISRDLYYLLSGLELAVPPLRERREDLEKKIDDTIRDCCDRYSRFHKLTSSAREMMLSYPWYGNLFQIESFCERLILTAQKRVIDETMVEKLLRELYPESAENEPERDGLETSAALSAPLREKARIQAALEHTGGSREEAARELGISKATLWRRMKKYGIEY